MFKKIALLSSLSLIVACSTIDTTAEYSSGTPRSTGSLATPPGLSAPDSGDSSYKMLTGQPQGYELQKINNMRIVQSGSQRWLQVDNRSVNQVWPTVLAYLNELGLTVKYQNQGIGLIQTDWANRNNNVHETGIRAFFDWVGWGGMYSLPSQFMFRVNLWQDGNNALIFVTDFQMNEVYPKCIPPKYSKVEYSNNAPTSWMPLPPDPQLELDFLTRYMAYAGATPQEVKQQVAQVKAQAKMAYIQGTQLVVIDQFDRAWWRSGLALERVGLGVTDKNRSLGEYYVYPLQSQVDNPDPGFLSRWFGSDKNNLKMPTPKYTVKLTAQGDKTMLTITPYNNQTPDKYFDQTRSKYLDELVKQLQ